MDRLYTAASECLDRAINKKAALRKSVYDNEFKNKKQLLRLTCETLKYKDYLEKVLDSQNVMRHLLNSKKLADDRILCLILVYEIIFGMGIRVIDKQINQTLKAAKKDILFEHEQLKTDNVDPDSLAREAQSINVPRYIRVNTLKMSVDDALAKLQEAEFNFIDNAEITNQEKFNEAVQNLQQWDFFVDIHVPNLLVFHPNVDLHAFNLIEEKALIMQDKASCLPAYLLKPDKDSQVVDGCAAPGMKTSHLAAIMENNGKIWALDRDTFRCKTLSKMLEETGVTNAEILNQDFLRENTSGDDYSEIEYCLIDAPCSGSGMVKRNDYLKKGEFDQRRISSLSNLQSMLLKHALNMPNLKRLVYSTCSIHEEENEQVVQEALSVFADRFEIVDPMPEWEREIVGDYEFSSRCLRANPKKNLTNGFFIALFQAK